MINDNKYIITNTSSSLHEHLAPARVNQSPFVIGLHRLRGAGASCKPNFVVEYKFKDDVGAFMGSGVCGDPVGEAAAFSNFNSLELTSVSDWFEVADHASLDQTDKITVSMWVKKTTWSNRLAFAGKYNTTGPQASWAFGISSVAGEEKRLRVYIYNSGTALGVRCTTDSDVLVDNAWNHVAFTFDNGTLVIYHNGVSVAFTITFGPLPLAMDVNTAKLLIGEHENNSLSDPMGTGFIDEVSIWGVALTAGEVSQVYNSGTPADLTSIRSGDQVSWWRFSESTEDLWGVNDGTLIAGATYGTDVPP